MIVVSALVPFPLEPWVEKSFWLKMLRLFAILVRLLHSMIIMSALVPFSFDLWLEKSCWWKMVRLFALLVRLLHSMIITSALVPFSFDFWLEKSCWWKWWGYLLFWWGYRILQGVSVKVPFSPSMSQGLKLIKYWWSMQSCNEASKIFVLRRFLAEDPSSSSSSVHFKLSKNLRSFEDFRPKIPKIFGIKSLFVEEVLKEN